MMNAVCSACSQPCAEESVTACCGVVLCRDCGSLACPRCLRPVRFSVSSPKKDPSELASLRVLQRTLVYIVGLSPSVSFEDVLVKPQFLGQYGSIKKCVVNKNSGYKHGATGYSYGVYVTYEREEEAALCIAVPPRQAVNNFVFDGRELKASLGTTKYCSYFLRGAKCTKAECLFLHQLAPETDTFRRVRPM